MIAESNEISELFAPSLSEEYMGEFSKLIKKIEQAFPNYRNLILKRSIDAIALEANNTEAVKYSAALHILYDLTQQGWHMEVSEEQLYLKMSTEDLCDKAYIRYRLSSEKNAQFSNDSVKIFINKMEKKKKYIDKIVSIRNLVGDKDSLIAKIKNKEQIVKPYIQLVSNQRDEYTGYRYIDIWRYFRYTWSIPYKSMPGRNMFFLVRDAAQEFHPVIGIFALGNSVLNLSVRDNEIGWTVEAIKNNMARKNEKEISSQLVSQTNGKMVKAKKITYIESEEEYYERVRAYAERVILVLSKSLSNAINDIYSKDFAVDDNIWIPSAEAVSKLRQIYEELRDKAIDNERTSKSHDWEQETKAVLFKKKRALELSKLFEAVLCFKQYEDADYLEWLGSLIKSEQGKKAMGIALVANRKTKIGSNMMDIIVCGSIPPYNELLGGKLVSILACSPTVIKMYNERYANQISEIASRMKGQEIIRDSRLAFLGTTSLYSQGSSQYNRIKAPFGRDFVLQYKNMGITEGYGTVYFSKETTNNIMRMLELQDGGRRINNIFGEGTSPRFRLISKGLSRLGIKADAFLQHYSPRIVYSMELAKNTNDFLMGYVDDLEYSFNINDSEEVKRVTQELIDFWYERWLEMRIESVDIIKRLSDFKPEAILLSHTR